MGDTCCTAEQLAAIGINATDIALAFAWGMKAVLAVWAVGFAVGVVVDAIRKV